MSDGNWVACEERADGDNFHTSIYEDGYKGILIARCNQNGSYPEHSAIILAAGNRKQEAANLIDGLLVQIAGLKRQIEELERRQLAPLAAADSSEPEGSRG